MKFFIDTADIDEVKTFMQYGLIDGVTTNPSLIKKSGKDFKETIKILSELRVGDISAEVVSTETDGMIEQGMSLARLSQTGNVVIKLPLTMNGLAACKELTERGIRTNVTLCFSSAQAILAAKAGATYVSPFIGRLDDIGQDGMQLILEMSDIFRVQGFATQILAASIRGPIHVVQVARMGAHVVTVPSSVLKQMVHHPLTDAGLEKFLSDWKDTGQII